MSTTTSSLSPPPEYCDGPAGCAALLEALPQAAWVVDAQQLRIVAANAAAALLLGLGLHDVVGRPVLDFAATPEDHAFWLAAAADRDAALESDTLLRCADDAVLPVTRRIARMVSAQGADFFVVGLADRSAQVRRERELEVRVAELQGTLESLLDGILVTDLQGRIRNFNRRFRDLWEIPETLLHEKSTALLEWMQQQVDDPQRYGRRLAALEDSALLRASDIVVLQSGRVLERISLPQFSYGSPIGRVFAFREVRRPATEATTAA